MTLTTKHVQQPFSMWKTCVYIIKKNTSGYLKRHYKNKKPTEKQTPHTQQLSTTPRIGNVFYAESTERP